MSGIGCTGLLACVVLCCLATSLALPATLARRPDNDLSTASLEQLTQMQISVSSFARKGEDLWKTPAAVFVITREDIARSAVSSIPELLRMVPGMQVAQINASNWAVSARGFNSVYAHKLLVLIDGRTIYSEIYSGAQWDETGIPLDEIERIEVIRGPGAAVWGTNAVNGVVNIITRKAISTRGLRGSDNSSRIGETADIRYGGALGKRTKYRAFASYINRQPFVSASGTRAFDGGNTVRAGGRIDLQRSSSDWITVGGDLYGGHLEQRLVEQIALPTGPNGHESESIAGGHVLSRWEHKLENSDGALQLYFDDQSRHETATHVRARTIDVDYQNHMAAGSHHDLVWGSEFRFTADHLHAQILPTTRPDYRNYLGNLFVQDEFAVIPERLIVTLGSKIQEGTLAGFQVQPSGRILWAPSKVQCLWAAVSRAAVAPSIQDKYLAIPLALGVQDGLPVTGKLQGNPDFKPETVVAYELGYRRKINRTLTLDLASFYNVNSRIESLLPIASLVPTPAPHIFMELLYTNGFRARTSGIEASAFWKPLNTLSLQGSYTWIQAHTTHIDPNMVHVIVDSWNTPSNTLAGSASWSFAPRWSANTFFSYFTKLQPTIGLFTSETVPAYSRLDFHLTRKLGHSIQFDAGGTNLLRPRHSEFADGTSFILPAQVPRSAFVKAKWSF